MLLPLRRSQQQGFTLLEMMLALATVSILVAILQTPLLSFHNLILQQQQDGQARADRERFLLILKSEVLQSGYGLSLIPEASALQIKETEITLSANLNLDKDLLDSREKISYRFDAKTQRVLRKSRKGSFQGLLENVENLSFAQVALPQNAQLVNSHCLQVTFNLQKGIEKSIFCPLFF